jgi:hypothetical protein
VPVVDPEISAHLDRQAIVDLTIRYCWCLDEGKGAGLEDVFLPDATAHLGSATLLEGIDAIKGRVFDALGQLDDSQHLVANHQVTLAGDTATSRCYFQAQHVRAAAEGWPNYLVAGRYEDDLVRTPAGWRIRYRKLTVMWTDGDRTVVTGGR